MFIKKKVVLCIIYFAFIFSSIFMPMRASAGFPITLVGDIVEQSLNAVGVLIINKISQEITMEIANWASEAGGPLGQAFVRDFGTYFLEIGKQNAYLNLMGVSKDIGEQVRGKKFRQEYQKCLTDLKMISDKSGVNGKDYIAKQNECNETEANWRGKINENPFLRGATRQVLFEARRKYGDRRIGYKDDNNFELYANCTYTEFFESGDNCNGWDAYLALSRAENNPIGIAYGVKSDVITKAEVASQAAKEEVAAPEPILGKKKCVDRAEPVGKQKEGKCLRWVNVTPGSVVANQLSSALDFETDSLANRDELIEAVGSIIGSLIFSTLDDKLFNREEDGYSEYNFADFNDTFGSDYSASGLDNSSSSDAVGALSNSYNILGTELQDHINSLESLAGGEIDFTNNRLKTALYELDICLPGPDHGWQDRVGGIDSHGGREINEKVNTPRFLAPNSTDVNNMIISIIAKYTKSQEETEALDSASTRVSNYTREVAVMKGIKRDVHRNADIANIPANWEYKQYILYPEDWDALNETQRNAIAEQVGGIVYSGGSVPSAVLQRYWGIWDRHIDGERRRELIQNFRHNKTSELVYSAYGEAIKAYNIEAEEDLVKITGALDDCRLMRNLIINSDERAYSVMQKHADKYARGTSQFQTGYFVTDLEDSFLPDINNDAIKKLLKDWDPGEVGSESTYLCHFDYPKYLTEEDEDDGEIKRTNPKYNRIVDECDSKSSALLRQECYSGYSISMSCEHPIWYRYPDKFTFMKEFISGSIVDGNSSGGGDCGCNPLCIAAGEVDPDDC